MKNSLDALNNIFKKKEKRISKHKNRGNKIMHSKDQGEKKWKRNKQSPRNL